jgi:hypothetical protein
MLVFEEYFFQSFFCYSFRKTLKLKSHTLSLLFFHNFWRLNLRRLSRVSINNFFFKLMIVLSFYEYIGVSMRSWLPLLFFIENDSVI